MSPYVEAAIAAECLDVSMAAEGTRNDALFRAACNLYGLSKGDGDIPYQQVSAALLDAVAGTGLPRHEAEATLASAYRRTEPRDVPEQKRTHLHAVDAPPPSDDDAPPPEYTDEAPPCGEATPEAPKRLLCAADVTPRKVRWVWDRHIPRGKITILAGLPGVGKTTIALTVGACVSTGSPIPLSDAEPVDGCMAIVSTEDDADDTIVPRLITAEADLARCYIWPDELPVPALPDGGDELAALLQAHHIRVLVIDPLSAILSGTLDSHKDAEVRKCLAALRRIARETDCAIVGVAHLNKSAHGGALSRIGGSTAWVAAARSVLLVTHDPDGGQDDLVLAAAKVSSARRPSTLRLRRIDIDDVVTLEWVGTCDLDADDLVAGAGKGPAPVARDAATDWLAEWLGSGAQWASDSYEEAESAGHSKRTMARAKSALKVRTSRDGTSGRWVWELPS